MELEDILRKEIDHFFIMTQILNTIVLKGDETYRTMQCLAKLTNDQDQVSLDQLVKRLQNKFQLLLDENQNLTTEKELKLLPRIEQLLRENASMRNSINQGTEADGDNEDYNDRIEGLIVQNQHLADQLNQLKSIQASSYRDVNERSDL